MKRMCLSVALMAMVVCGYARAENKPLTTGAFEVTQTVVVPGTPAEIFDAFTGDISGWWDHTFSEAPVRLYIEPEPGGGFWEIFDHAGHGVLHATVTAADRGKLLRLVGPLGLAGYALDMVHTLEFTTSDEGAHTTVTLTTRAAGQMEDGWADAVDRVWHHFLVERFKPYVEAGKHRR